MREPFLRIYTSMIDFFFFCDELQSSPGLWCVRVWQSQYYMRLPVQISMVSTKVAHWLTGDRLVGESCYDEVHWCTLCEIHRTAEAAVPLSEQLISLFSYLKEKWTQSTFPFLLSYWSFLVGGVPRRDSHHFKQNMAGLLKQMWKLYFGNVSLINRYWRQMWL